MKTKGILFRITEEQHTLLEDFIIKNKRNGGNYKSFNTLCQTAINEFIANHINKLADKQTPKLPSPDTNPFARLKF